MKQEFTNTPTDVDLAIMSRKIDALKRQAKGSKIEAKEAFESQLRAVEDRYDLMVAKMDKASHRAGAATKEVKEGLSKAWIELKSSFDSASKYLH